MPKTDSSSRDKIRRQTMISLNPLKISIAMAEKEMTPIQLSISSGVPASTVYAMRRGCYVKPMYAGKVCKALELRVEQAINGVSDGKDDIEQII